MRQLIIALVWLQLLRLSVCWLAAESASSLADEVDRLIPSIAAYQSGQNMEPLRGIERIIRESARFPEARKAIEKRLLTILSGQSTAEGKQFAAEQLATIGTDESLPAIAQLLQNPQTLSLACRVLAAYSSSRSSDVLRDALHTLKGPGRSQIVAALGDRHDLMSLPAFASLVNDPESSVASAAILSLGGFTNLTARQTIADLRKATNPALASAITEASMHMAEALSGNGENDLAMEIYQELVAPSQPDSVRRGAFEALMQLDADGGEKRLLQVLGGTDTILKPVAITRVRTLRSEESSAKFAEALPRLAPPEQVWLLDALGNRTDAASQTAIVRSLSSPDLSVRFAAIQACAKLGDSALAFPLCQALRNTLDPKERSALERALSSLEKGSAVDEMILTQYVFPGPNLFRLSLLAVFQQRKAINALPVIFEATQVDATAEAAFRVLADLVETKDLPLLLDHLVHLKVAAVRGDAESAVDQALRRIADPRQRTALVTATWRQTVDLSAKCSLLRVLPACGETNAIDLIKRARVDSNPIVRDVALRALTEWPENSAWDQLAQACLQPETKLQSALAFNALVGLAEADNPQASAVLVERYQWLLDHAQTDENRRLVLGALSGVAHPAAAKLAANLLANPAVRAEAELAIKGIQEAGSRPVTAPSPGSPTH